MFTLVAAFFFLLEASQLEAESLNIGTLVGREDPGPTVDLVWVGVAFATAAGVFAGLAWRRR